jgi:SAM-dependent methyltransferase
MEPKPSQWSGEHALQWCDAAMARAYRHRPPYPEETIEALCGLVPEALAPGAVLDVGCGTGFAARALVRLRDRVMRVDAVDRSGAMIEAGRREPSGDDPALRWIVGAIEEAPLEPPYALAVAAASLHWLDWERALPRLRSVLALEPGAVLAAVQDVLEPAPWDAAVRSVCARYSANRDFHPYDLGTVVAELEKRGLFRAAGEHLSEPVRRRQRIDHWIESLHARNGFSRDRMPPPAAAACDAELREILAPFAVGGAIEFRISARITYGEPLAVT